MASREASQSTLAYTPKPPALSPDSTISVALPSPCLAARSLMTADRIRWPLKKYPGAGDPGAETAVACPVHRSCEQYGRKTWWKSQSTGLPVQLVSARWVLASFQKL